MNFRSVVVYGAPREVTDADERDMAQRALVEHVVPGRTAEVRMPSDKELKETSIFAIGLDEASAKIRTGPPIDPEADLTSPVWAGVLPVRTGYGDPIPSPDLTPGISPPGYVTGYRRPGVRRPHLVSAPPAEQRTLRENLRGLPREVWVLYLGAFVNRLGTFVLPFITLYLHNQRGYSVPQAGLGLAAYGLGAIAAQGVGGLLADRLGRRNTIMLSMTGGAFLTLSLVWVTSLAGIVGIVLLLGFVGELYRPASSALIADLVPRRAASPPSAPTGWA